LKAEAKLLSYNESLIPLKTGFKKSNYVISLLQSFVTSQFFARVLVNEVSISDLIF